MQPWFRAFALCVTAPFLALWLGTAVMQAPRAWREAEETLACFTDIQGEVTAAERADPAHLTRRELKIRTVIDPTYRAFLRRKFPDTFARIMRELIMVDFRYPVTKAAYVIDSEKPPRGTTILMFSQADWMADWCAAKFFEYHWVNIAPPARLGDSRPTRRKVYQRSDLPEILGLVAKYQPAYILAHNAFTEVLPIPGFTTWYVQPDRTYGWTILYRRRG